MIYDKPVAFWDNVFSKEKVSVPIDQKIGVEALDRGLDWLIKDTASVLDFGCGNGSFLFYAALRGAQELRGIDLSKEAINLAQKRAKLMEQTYQFTVGDAQSLAQIKTASFDAVILSNIIDNLTYEDAEYTLGQINRILKKSGKVFLKMNPYIEQEEYEKNHIIVIEDDLLDDGLLLLNKTSSEWKEVLSKWFNVVEESCVYYEQHDAYNRLFFLTKK